jgi:RNA-directed DNA polymerase
MVLEPIFEADFRPSSFGFRPTRCTMDAIMAVHWAATERKKYFWIVEGDISAYFDTIKHRKLVKLLRRRVKDRKVLSLIWQFLRAGVMERKLFKDTTQGAPQGGILSPLLANVYLHELDKFMERYTGLSENMKAARRDKGLGNYHYVRYADDFVILTNGDKAHALSIRDEVQMFLTSELRIELSMEKTKITHVNDGFDFLGFHVRRTTAGNGEKRLKILVPPKKAKAHLDKLKAVFALSSTSDSVIAKIKAANRIISGWCRYYQFTSQPSKSFANLEHRTYWLAIQWLATKFKIPYTEAVPRFQCADGLGTPDIRLMKHSNFKARRYSERIFKPNPYTTQTIPLTRESLDDGSYWMGNERRPGMSDLRPAVLKRDGYTCQAPGCGKPLAATDSEVHHKLPVRSFRRPVDANAMGNLMAVCIPCHRKLTEFDQRMESPVR